MVAIKIKGIEIPKQCASCFARTMVDGTISTYEICALTQSVLSTEDLCDKRNHNCPLVEIEERKAGLCWIERFDTENKWLECPYCHKDSDNAYNYCPNCGVDMRGAENG